MAEWAPGYRGGGRPKGSPNREKLWKRVGLTPEYAAKELKKAIESGDSRALSEVVKRIWPEVQKIESDVTLNIPKAIEFKEV